MAVFLRFGAVCLLPAVLVACGGDKEDTDPPASVDLGSYPVADTGGFTGDIVVEVPEGAVSTIVYCGGFGDDTLGAVWYLTDPDGNVVYDADNPDPMTFRSEFMDDMSVGMLPVTPNLDLRPGTWKFNWWIGADNPGSVKCDAVIRTDAAGSDADIEVNLVFVGLGDLHAGTAADHAGLQSALSQFEAEWASAGLTPSYTYSDFTGDVTTYSVVDVTDTDYSEFNALLRTAAPSNDRSLTFFFVQEISSTGGATILGLSAGPPGAATVPGTSKSGVIVTAVDIDADPTSVAKIMAHEGGHFLGLYHTTEKDGLQHDPLSDSPECNQSNDANANGIMNSDECADKGAENVMWWTLTGGTASFSGDQGWVLRRNPAAN